MADRTVVDAGRSIVLPERTDPVAVAAPMNPAMSSWIALRRRSGFETGQQVSVLGATGSAGRLAVQVAGLLGAGGIVAAGRDAVRLARLPALGATDRLGDIAGDVDVVLDYAWGNRLPTPWAPWSPTVPTGPGRSPGCRSDQWQDRTRRSRPPRCVRPGYESSAADSAR